MRVSQKLVNLGVEGGRLLTPLCQSLLSIKGIKLNKYLLYITNIVHLVLEILNVSMHLVHVECLENFPVDEVSLVVSDMMRTVLVIVIFVQVYH